MNANTATDRLLETIDVQPVSDPLINRVGRYLDDHPEITREEFLRNALERELDVLKMSEAYNKSATAQEIRDHTWIEQQLAEQRRHRGLGSKLRDLFHGNH